MSSKAVILKGGNRGLAHPEPKKGKKTDDAGTAADKARSGSVAAARKKASNRAGAVTTKRKKLGTSDAEKIKPTKRRAVQQADPTDAGSEIGRRVGGTRKNLEKVQARAMDDHGPDATKHTARRNVKLNDAGMTSALEDSATGKPSRKSTRKSANRSKPSQLTRRVQRTLHSPESRAARSRAAH